ncbi:MAG TPA: tannase/feruloyl esterase family alpha/beta hydrolase [Candidatus Acidoferrales bacterium]|nr:tannase/feruloyl esterase family alpha/beta hydrolase [Candidatus Acidoferrales bacterium]
MEILKAGFRLVALSRSRALIVFSSAIVAAFFFAAAPAHAASCESLASLSLPNTTITKADLVPAGSFTPPAPVGPPPPIGAEAIDWAHLPAFCRVTATLKPTSDSDIRIEVWLPASGWNGKYEAVGGGGWAGVISYPDMNRAIVAGYATSSTDTGHVGATGTFALGHPEKVVDYAYRSEHEMTVKAKAIIAAFYGKPPHFSYWNGCSTGGKQGLTEAQRYPKDYDGIIAGAPANYMIHLHVFQVAIWDIAHKTPEAMIPAAKYPMLHAAVLNECDALDGLKDGLIEDPLRCHFNPKSIECKGGDEATCLTPAQVQTADAVYGPLRNPRTKQVIFPGLEPGSELGWTMIVNAKEPLVAPDTFKYIIFKDPNWDNMKLNLDSDVAYADKLDHGMNNAIDPNLNPFFAHGGKLILYHGWADQLIAPRNTLNYYASVLKTVGAPAKQDMRVFMVPGMQHCRGGEGPSAFDLMPAISQWTEGGKAPAEVIAAHKTKGTTDRTRPLCPYPQIAKYKGSGSIDDAANFVCAMK